MFWNIIPKDSDYDAVKLAVSEYRQMNHDMGVQYELKDMGRVIIREREEDTNPGIKLRMLEQIMEGEEPRIITQSVVSQGGHEYDKQFIDYLDNSLRYSGLILAADPMTNGTIQPPLFPVISGRLYGLRRKEK